MSMVNLTRGYILKGNNNHYYDNDELRNLEKKCNFGNYFDFNFCGKFVEISNLYYYIIVINEFMFNFYDAFSQKNE